MAKAARVEELEAEIKVQRMWRESSLDAAVAAERERDQLKARVEDLDQALTDASLTGLSVCRERDRYRKALEYITTVTQPRDEVYCDHVKVAHAALHPEEPG